MRNQRHPGPTLGAGGALRKNADLPNRDGFRFIAVCRDGRRARCKVIRRHSDGCHTVRGVKYEDMVGWEPDETKARKA